MFYSMITFNKMNILSHEEAAMFPQEETKPKQYQLGIDTFGVSVLNQTPEERLAIARFMVNKYTFRDKGQAESDFLKAKDYIDFGLQAIKEMKEKRLREYQITEEECFSRSEINEDIKDVHSLLGLLRKVSELDIDEIEGVKHDEKMEIIKLRGMSERLIDNIEYSLETNN